MTAFAGIGILSVLASAFMASASIIKGFSDFKLFFKNFKIKSLAERSVESPQPIDIALYFDISFKIFTPSFGMVNFSAVPRCLNIISGVFEATIESVLLSPARHTSPAPALSAETELKYAAPGYERHPAMFKTVPYVPLFEFG